MSPIKAVPIRCNRIKARPTRNRWKDGVDREEVEAREYEVPRVKGRLLVVDVYEWEPEDVFYVGTSYNEKPKYGAGGTAVRPGSPLASRYSLWQVSLKYRARANELYSHWLKAHVMIPGLNHVHFEHCIVKDDLRVVRTQYFKASECLTAWNELVRLARQLRAGKTVRLAAKNIGKECHADVIARALVYLFEKGYA